MAGVWRAATSANGQELSDMSEFQFAAREREQRNGPRRTDCPMVDRQRKSLATPSAEGGPDIACRSTTRAFATYGPVLLSSSQGYINSAALSSLRGSSNITAPG